MKAPIYLLDTNVLMHLLRGNDIGNAIDSKYRLRENQHRHVISVVTAGELLGLANKNGWGANRLQQLQELLKNLVIIDVTHPAITRAYMDVYKACSGHPIPQNDMWIAATCKATGATLLSCDQDFHHLDGNQISLEFFQVPKK